MRDAAGQQNETANAHRKLLAIVQRKPVRDELAKRKHTGNKRREMRQRIAGVQSV
ncbi:MAG: hypothetical protein OXL97_07770 [Chloroflexota bacterium]|nr:hypothetical protein [Chloroflexota bacterium]MDE2883796.1 hypothetical protein [Chloroflexota bacterium]